MTVISRRDLLKTAGLASAAIVVIPALPELSRVLAVRRDLIAQAASGATTLTPAELATLRAVCGRIIPSDENGPGATEAGAANYIDRALGGALAESRRAYVEGLASIDAAAQRTHGAPFAKLPTAQQDAVLTGLQDSPFFNLVRGHTLQGTFCDPIYGGNVNFVGWDLIGYPGVRLTVSAAEQNMSTPAVRNHKSAYDYLMFSKPAA